MKLYRFDKTFREIFLDIWWSESPGLYNHAWDDTQGSGNEMMIWLAETRRKYYNEIYKQTLSITRENLRL